MGTFRFQASPELYADSVLDQAYLAGIEGLPWCTRSGANDVGFAASRDTDDTAILHYLWRSGRVGEVMLSSSSLMHRDQPYDLALELARGTVNRVRSFAGELRVAGFVLSSDAEQLVASATDAFINLLVTPERSTALASETVERALQAGEAVCSEYAKQAIAHRKRQSPRLPTMIAAQVADVPTADEEQAIMDGFNTVSIPFHWGEREPNPGKYEWDAVDRRIQWCNERGLRVCAGPLISLQRSTIPDWAYLWEDDFDQILECASNYISAVVERYRGRVNVWHSAARINEGGALDVSEEQRLRLYLTSLQTIRNLDRETPVVASLDQPWGEYLRKQDVTLSPFHYADELVRSELGIAGIGLELNYGFRQNATFPRDWVEFSRQLDRWSMLGAPVMIEIAAPRSSAEDDAARLKSAPMEIMPGETDPQLWFMQHALPILLAKPYVHGVICNEVLSRARHDFANVGLIDNAGNPNPALQWLTSTRRDLLM